MTARTVSLLALASAAYAFTHDELAACYVSRYPALRAQFCDEDRCDTPALRDHYRDVGATKKMLWGCRGIRSQYATAYTRSFLIPKTFDTSQARDTIDAAVYINLAERENRRMHIEKELHKVKNVCKAIERIDAVKNDLPPKGCAMSHIKALKRAKAQGWKSVMIVEDDLEFRDDHVALLIAYAVRSYKFDVLMISGNIISKKIQTPGLSKALKVQTTSYYVVRDHYYDTLINTFDESAKNLSNRNIGNFAIDIHWSKLQQRDNWLIFTPTLGIQKRGYSDIGKKYVDYGV